MDGPGPGDGDDNRSDMVTSVVDDVLAHHGIKGMHWGVRRTEAQLEKARKMREASSEDANNARDQKKRIKSEGTHVLSNKELQEVIARMNLEQQYARLRPLSNAEATKKYILEILANAGKQEVTKFASKQISDLLKQATRS